MSASFANRIDMQNRLFSELSAMFGREVPMYDKSLLVNRICNRAVCDLLSDLFTGFSMSEEQLERTSGERHGAIRIGRPDEYRWICRYFSAFGMEPHNYFDMSDVGSKSQPIVATAFRSVWNPEHRVFCSLLMTDYFDADTKARIEAALSRRQVFSETARALIEKCETEGGLAWEDADSLIREGTDRIFRWTGSARDHTLYTDLCGSGFKIAADIACFESHHLNHLTPNTLCMDLYTAAMKRCMGELDRAAFVRRAQTSLERLTQCADRHWMRLHFRHLSNDDIDSFDSGRMAPNRHMEAAGALSDRLEGPDLELFRLAHCGFKDFTEGPAWDTPVLLRQDAYRALSEPVRFTELDGSVVDGVHTARFGEIEQRFYATTPAGRALYDECLARAEAMKDADPNLVRRDFQSYEAQYADCFCRFPKTLNDLRAGGLVYVRYAVTRSGLLAAAEGAIVTADTEELLRKGYLRFEGLRYEDFLPVSAAGIFASNLNQYGTRSTARERPVYSVRKLEEVLGRPILDSDRMYRAMEAQSLYEALVALGVADRLSASDANALKSAASALSDAADEAGAPRTLQPIR